MIFPGQCPQQSTEHRYVLATESTFLELRRRVVYSFLSQGAEDEVGQCDRLALEARQNFLRRQASQQSLNGCQTLFSLGAMGHL